MRDPATLLLLSLVITASGSPDNKTSGSTLKKHASGVTRNPWDATSQTYDYVVVGDALTGITVAARLAEDPNNQILIIETGDDNLDDPLVYDIYDYTQAFGTDMDWQLPTDYGRQMIAGRTLRGGSSINGAAWTRGLAAHYDAWGALLETSEAYLNWNCTFSN